MKLFDSGVELLVIRTLVDSPIRGTTIMSKLETDYFGYDASIEIYNRIKILVEAGKQVPSIDLLRTDPILSEVSKTWLASDVTPLGDDDFESAYKSLMDYRKSRLIIENLQFSSESMTGESPNIDSVLTAMESMISRCRSGMQTDEMFHISDSSPEVYLSGIEEDLRPETGQFIQSGFREFDKRTGGFRRGQVLILSAPSGSGKSAMMGQMAVLQYMMGFNVCVISFEMTNEDLRMRMTSTISKLNHADIHVRRLVENQKELVRKKAKEFVQTGFGNRLTLWGSSEDIDVKDIASRVKPHKFDVIYIDYIGLLKEPPSVSQQKALGDHVRNAKLMAKNLNCLVVPLAQLDDETLKLKYSKAIKANSDFIWSWYIAPKEEEAGVVKIVQDKARSASPYDFHLACDFSRMSFEDYSGPPPIDVPKEQPALPKMPNISG